MTFTPIGIKGRASWTAPFFLALAIMLGPTQAAARDDMRPTLDPQGLIRPALLREGLNALDSHRARLSATDRIGLIDFDKPSHEPRLFVLDLKTGAVETFLVAHGRGSDRDHDGMIDALSDRLGSGASTGGAFRTAETYCGENGKTLLLEGLDPGNANAFARAIVLHSTYLEGRTPYMTREQIATFGRPGRSCGCFVVLPEDLRHVIDALGGGRLLYAASARSLPDPAPADDPPQCAGPAITKRPEPGRCDWPTD